MTTSDPSPPGRTAALPVFSAPPSQLLDPALAPVLAPTPPPDQDPSPAASNPWQGAARRLLGRNTSPDGQPKPQDPSDDAGAFSAGTRTSTDGRRGWIAGGDPTEVGETIAGLIAIAGGFLVVRAARRGRQFRAPNPVERDAIAFPVARILVRHLPMQAIGADIKDAAQAARATQDYVQAGPLLTRTPELNDPI